MTSGMKSYWDLIRRERRVEQRQMKGSSTKKRGRERRERKRLTLLRRRELCRVQPAKRGGGTIALLGRYLVEMEGVSASKNGGRERTERND